MDFIRRAIDYLRDFPITAPIVAAVDTAIAVVTFNVRRLLAEPLVVLGAVTAAANALLASGETKGYALAYVVAAARYFTEPVHDNR